MCSQIAKYIPQAAGIVYLIDGTEYNVSSIAESFCIPFLDTQEPLRSLREPHLRRAPLSSASRCEQV